MYYRVAAAAIIVFDIMNPASFDRAKKWVQDLQAQGNPNMVTALAGNKADLLDARRVTAEMNKNEGSLGSFPEFYKETHYNVKKGKWATPECERLHSEMERDEWQNSQSDVAPLTAEQMSIKHLRAQSGVVKGIGIRPSSSLQTTAASLQVSDEVVRHLVKRAKLELQQKLTEQKRGETEERVRGEMEEQLQMEREKRLQLEQKLDALLEYMKSGHQVPYPPPDDGSAGCSLGVV